LHHAQLAHLFEKVFFYLPHGIHLEHYLRGRFCRLVAYRTNGFLDYRNVQRPHTEFFKSHSQQQQSGKRISRHFTAHSDSFPFLLGGRGWWSAKRNAWREAVALTGLRLVVCGVQPPVCIESGRLCQYSGSPPPGGSDRRAERQKELPP